MKQDKNPAPAGFFEDTRKTDLVTTKRAGAPALKAKIERVYIKERIMSTFVLIRGVYYLKKKPFSLAELLRNLWSREKKPYLNNTPRFIKVYDNGGATIDRYTVIFTEKKVNGREYLVLKLSEEADGQFHNMHTMLVDTPSKKSVALAGEEIRFADLPVHCRDVVLEYYGDLWNVN